MEPTHKSIAPLTSDVIEDLLKPILPNLFYGVFSKENLPFIDTKPATFIVNSDNASQPGEHWVVLWFDECGNGEYFDPLGLPPLYKEWETYLQAFSCNGEWIYSSKTVQNPLCSSCGYHCIHYILMRNLGISPQDILTSYTSNLDVNDHYVFNIVKSLV